MLTVKEALRLEALQDVKVVAGVAGLDRQIRWCHIIDNPEIVRWIQGGELLLTTGYGWPEVEQTSRRTIRALNAKRLAAILFDPGPFLGEIPANVVDEAGRLELPVLVAPRKLRFADVTEAVGRELVRRQYEMIERADRYHRQITAAAVEAKDLNDIARTVCELTRRSVAIEDAESRPLARADRLSADSPAAVKLPWADAPAEARAVRERLLHADGAVRLDGGAACAIRAGTELLGYLRILEGDAPLGDLELRVAEHGSMVAALHILRQRSQAAVEARIGHTVVDALIRGDVPEEDLIERSRLLGFDPDADYVVMMVSLVSRAARGRKWPLTSRDEYYRRERAAQIVRRLLGQEQLPTLVTYSLNRVVCLLPVGRMPRLGGTPGRVRGLLPDESEWLRRFGRVVHGSLAEAGGVPPALVTFGTAHAGLSGVAKGHWEADRALALAKDGDGVLFFEDLTLAHLLAQISDTASLQAMYARTLGPALAGPMGRVLRETLWALVDAGFNKEAAASALGIHRNTMRGRLERAQALLCRSLDDATVRRDLAVIKEIEHLLVSEPR